MDAFEASLGYRSLIPALSPPGAWVRVHLSEAGALQLARDMFDAHLAETLRTGAWHWKLEIVEIAEEVAETLCFGEQSGYERLRSALLEYYEERYRRPTAKEFLAYLRGKRAEKMASPGQLSRPVYPCPYHADREGTQECPRCHRLYCPECRTELFLPIDPRFWAETAMMCAQCHHEVYGTAG